MKAKGVRMIPITSGIIISLPRKRKVIKRRKKRPYEIKNTSNILRRIK